LILVGVVDFIKVTQKIDCLLLGRRWRRRRRRRGAGGSLDCPLAGRWHAVEALLDVLLHDVRPALLDVDAGEYFLVLSLLEHDDVLVLDRQERNSALGFQQVVAVLVELHDPGVRSWGERSLAVRRCRGLKLQLAEHGR